MFSLWLHAPRSPSDLWCTQPPFDSPLNSPPHTIIISTEMLHKLKSKCPTEKKQNKMFTFYYRILHSFTSDALYAMSACTCYMACWCIDYQYDSVQCCFFLTWVGYYENHFGISAHTFIFRLDTPWCSNKILCLCCILSKCTTIYVYCIARVLECFHLHTTMPRYT